MGGALGCTEIAAIVKGIEGDGHDADVIRQSQPTERKTTRASAFGQDEHREEDFRTMMRTRAGMADPDLVREQEVQVKLQAVLERCKEEAVERAEKNGKRKKGDPLALLREGTPLGMRIKVAMSTFLEWQFEPHACKTVNVEGAANLECAMDECKASIRSERGRSPHWHRTNQDEAFYLLTKDGYRIAGVFDGHGEDGARVADVVRDFVCRRLVAQLPSNRPENIDEYRKDMNALLVNALKDANNCLFTGDEAADARMSGATACVVVHDVRKRWLFTAWAGDCRCTVCELQDDAIGSDASQDRGPISSKGSESSKGTRSQGKSSKASSRRRRRDAMKRFLGKRFSNDHQLNLANERVRIAYSGASILPGTMGLDEVYAPGTKYPGVPFSRCLGNLVGKRLGITDEPEVADRPQEEILDEYGVKVKFVVLATDGIWSVLKDQAVIDLVKDVDKQNLHFATNLLVQTAWQAWDTHQERFNDYIDDITCILFWL
eukprot:gb/GFBE01037688.1/.p1 GENE.gb/GFBE01037688.1/~~gb/GFBE01037688.1/.p1  ORF type:complete len:491 (+),score=93.54 gb/GFBE01037688.1/:1-1473(+)